MQQIRWFRLLAVGALLVPGASRAQGPQPRIREIATIPGVYVDEVDLPQVAKQLFAWLIYFPESKLYTILTLTTIILKLELDMEFESKGGDTSEY